MKKDISEETVYCDCKKPIIMVLGIVLTVLFLFLSLSIMVDIMNKVKQSKYIGQDAQFKNTIVISDTGEIYAKPDLAVIDFTVVNEALKPADAIAENSEKMNAVIAEIKNQGVEEKDLKTIIYNIYPRYEYEEDYYGQPVGERTLVGYEVSQTLEVKIRNMAKIGTIIEKATLAGANQIGSLYFTIDKEDELKSQARNQAIQKAKAKALEMASQLGVRLGKVVSFSENYYIPFSNMDYAKGIGGAGEESAPSIEAGQNKITASVVITYEIY